MLPLVTILAVSYNQKRFVIDALNSVKAQTYPNIQLIISDDGSTDGTKRLIKDWIASEYPSAMFLDHVVNQGLTKNLNSARQFVKGKYYQFLGCEDIMLPSKIAMQVALLEQKPEVDIVYSDMHRMREDGSIESTTHFQRNEYNVPRSGLLYEDLINGCFISTPTALMRTHVVEALNGYNENLTIDDFDFWIRASRQFNFFFHEEVTMNYRIMNDSLSNKDGVHRYKNRFLVYYFNYDRRLQYKEVFDERLDFSLKNLLYNQYKGTALYSAKAFFKSWRFSFALIFFKSLPLLIKR